MSISNISASTPSPEAAQAAPNWTQKWLQRSAIGCYTITALGQWIFVLYVLVQYVITGLQGRANQWSQFQVLPHGLEAGNTIGNTSLTIHLFMAALITALGTLQLLTPLRKSAPAVHRWSGRLYITAATLMGTSGLYLSYSGRKVVGDFSQHIAISGNAVLILIFSVLALYTAHQRDFRSHRRYALSLFWAVSGVWLFRVGLTGWLIIHQGPVGFDVESFTGPFLSWLAVMVYLFPALAVHLYLSAEMSRSHHAQALAVLALVTLSACLCIGIFGASALLWIPRMLA